MGKLVGNTFAAARDLLLIDKKNLTAVAKPTKWVE